MNKILEKKSPVNVYQDTSEVLLLVSTSKGGFIYYSDEKRRFWEVNGPFLLGSIVHHLILDYRDNKTLLMAAQTKAHGANIFKSTDFGMNWIPVKTPPAFSSNKKVAHIYCLTPGHPQSQMYGMQVHRPKDYLDQKIVGIHGKKYMDLIIILSLSNGVKVLKKKN